MADAMTFSEWRNTVGSPGFVSSTEIARASITWEAATKIATAAERAACEMIVWRKRKTAGLEQSNDYILGYFQGLSEALKKIEARSHE